MSPSYPGALDWWESARFQAVFCTWTFFRIMSLVHARPPASNAQRWLAGS